MKKATIHVLRIIGAIACIIVGLAGLLLPIIPGILLIATGLVLAGIIEKEDIKHFIDKFRRR